MFTSLEQLIKHLEETEVLHSKNIKEALEKVDRCNFVREEQESLAYNDEPLPTACGQTMSQPSTVAFMLENLKVEKGQKILDIGGGGAWISCLLGYLVGETGHVYSFEINQEVGRIGKENIEKCDAKNVTYEVGNAADLWGEYAPYDRIHGAAAFKAIPEELKELLTVGGILVAPTQDGNIRVIKRESENKFLEEAHHGFVFVPFIEK